jgi:hypothetical protein
LDAWLNTTEQVVQRLSTLGRKLDEAQSGTKAAKALGERTVRAEFETG